MLSPKADKDIEGQRTDEPESKVASIVGDDRGLPYENTERFKPYYAFHAQIRGVIEANPEKFNVDYTFLDMLGSASVRSRINIDGVTYEVNMSTGRNDQTGLLEESAGIYECEVMHYGDDQFAQINRFMALHEVAVRLVRVEDIKSEIVRKENDYEDYIGRATWSDEGPVDIFIFSKNFSLLEGAQLLFRVAENSSELKLINRFDPTYKDYQTEMARRANGRKLLE